jgi:hypothetical protein
MTPISGVELGVAYQNLKSSKRIIPLLTVSVQSTLAEDLDVLSTPSPKGDRLLEGVVEVVCLPIVDIIGKLRIISTQFHSPLLTVFLP